MSVNSHASDWSQVSKQIKGRFTKLTDENITSLHEKIEMLAPKLESVYGYSKREADKEVETFKSTLETESKSGSKTSSREPHDKPKINPAHPAGNHKNDPKVAGKMDPVRT